MLLISIAILFGCFFCLVLQPNLAEGDVIDQDIMDLKEGLYQQVVLHHFSYFSMLYNEQILCISQSVLQ